MCLITFNEHDCDIITLVLNSCKSKCWCEHVEPVWLTLGAVVQLSTLHYVWWFTSAKDCLQQPKLSKQMDRMKGCGLTCFVDIVHTALFENSKHILYQYIWPYIIFLCCIMWSETCCLSSLSPSCQGWHVHCIPGTLMLGAGRWSW